MSVISNKDELSYQKFCSIAKDKLIYEELPQKEYRIIYTVTAYCSFNSVLRITVS